MELLKSRNLYYLEISLMYSGDLQGKQERSLVINYIFEFVACLFLLPFYGRKFIT